MLLSPDKKQIENKLETTEAAIIPVFYNRRRIFKYNKDDF